MPRLCCQKVAELGSTPYQFDSKELTLYHEVTLSMSTCLRHAEYGHPGMHKIQTLASKVYNLMNIRSTNTYSHPHPNTSMSQKSKIDVRNINSPSSHTSLSNTFKKGVDPVHRIRIRGKLTLAFRHLSTCLGVLRAGADRQRNDTRSRYHRFAMLGGPQFSFLVKSIGPEVRWAWKESHLCVTLGP